MNYFHTEGESMSIKKITSAILAVALCFGTAMPTMGNAAVYPVEGEIVNTYYENQVYMGKKDDPNATLADGETITVTLALDMANTVVYYK